MLILNSDVCHLSTPLQCFLPSDVSSYVKVRPAPAAVSPSSVPMQESFRKKLFLMMFLSDLNPLSVEVPDCFFLLEHLLAISPALSTEYRAEQYLYSGQHVFPNKDIVISEERYQQRRDINRKFTDSEEPVLSYKCSTSKPSVLQSWSSWQTFSTKLRRKVACVFSSCTISCMNIPSNMEACMNCEPKEASVLPRSEAESDADRQSTWRPWQFTHCSWSFSLWLVCCSLIYPMRVIMELCCLDAKSLWGIWVRLWRKQIKNNSCFPELQKAKFKHQTQSAQSIGAIDTPQKAQNYRCSSKSTKLSYRCFSVQV